MKKKLAIISTHPIQYNAPVFQLLAESNKIEIMVFYTWGKDVVEEKFDPGFGRTVQWDIPLLEGYPFKFLENISDDKGSHHFAGIDNPDIIREIKNFAPDAVLVFGWSFKSHLKVMRHFKNKIHIIFRGDSTLLDKQSFFSCLKRGLFLTWLYRYVDIALYAGKSNYDYFLAFGLKKRQLVFAPHAIDNTRFNLNEQQEDIENPFRTGFNIPEDDFVYMFAGKLEEKKNITALLTAFVELKFDSDVHLIIAGSGPQEQQLHGVAEGNKNIHFAGFQNQQMMPYLYDSANVFVLPSKGPGETWGLSVNEAMANGKFVIVSNKCGCAIDLVEPGVNGYTFDTDEPEDLKRKLLLALDFRNSASKVKESAQEKISLYSFNAIVSAIESSVISN